MRRSHNSKSPCVKKSVCEGARAGGIRELRGALDMSREIPFHSKQLHVWGNEFAVGIPGHGNGYGICSYDEYVDLIY
jgi:hypothetical protein